MSEEIVATSSRVVYENRWMRVREDAILRQDGTPGIYGVVEKADFAVIAAIEDGRVHLVEQYRYPVAGRYWELPQGSLERAPDADPLDVARAELKEETGLTASGMHHVGHLFECYGYSTQGYHIFLATGLTQGPPELEPEEHGLVSRSFPLEEVEAMIRDGIIKDATTVAALGLLRIRGFL